MHSERRIANPNWIEQVAAYWFAAVIGTTLMGCTTQQSIEPLAKDRVEWSKEIDGQVFHVATDGNAYREIEEGKRWVFHAKLYDPEEILNAYVETEGKTFRVAPDTDKRYLTRQSIDETFEGLEPGVSGLQALIDEKRELWGSFTLQSPKAPSVSEYVRLRRDILKEKRGFLDAVIEPTREKSHRGASCLKFFSPAKTQSMVTSKASISSPLVYFREGDDFWFDAYYWAEGVLPLTLVDLESEFLEQHAGIRVRIYEDETLGAELKALDKPQYRQAKEEGIRFPRDRWVGVRVHYYLSPSDGLIEIWQDGKRVLKSQGTTLPFQSTIYNSLEVGITAHSNPAGDCVLFVDDLRVSDKPFE